MLDRETYLTNKREEVKGMVTYEPQCKCYGWLYYKVYLDGKFVETCDENELSETIRRLEAR